MNWEPIETAPDDSNILFGAIDPTGCEIVMLRENWMRPHMILKPTHWIQNPRIPPLPRKE